MKILHSTNDWLSLTKKWLYDQVRYSNNEFKHDVWCDEIIGEWNVSNNTGIYQEKISSVVRLKKKVFNKAFPTVLQSLKSNVVDFGEYDVIVSHFGTRAWHDLPYVSKKTNLKKVVRFYGYDLNVGKCSDVWRKRYAQIFKKYDIIVSMGPAMTRQLIDIGAPKGKVIESALGIDQEDMLEIKTNIKSCVDPLKIIIIGSFVQKKGIPLAIEGIADFVKQTKKDVQLTIVGDVNKSDRGSLLEGRKIQSAAMRANFPVEFTGYLNYQDLIKEIDKNLIVLTPSITADDGDNEGGYNLTTVLAASRGLINLSSNHCDGGLLLIDRQSGIVFEENSATEISDALNYIVELSCEELEGYSKKSLSFMRSNFVASDLQSQLLDNIQVSNA